MSSGSEDTEGESWVQWFCNLKGNEFFCEVERQYIEDGFNLYGLRTFFPGNFQECLDLILDRIDPDESEDDDEKTTAAMRLYGLIHARFIITSHGLNAMLTKYRRGEFGKCPRALCWGQCVVPIGSYVDPNHEHVKVFCPRCGEVYTPVMQAGAEPVDGAFFGPTFAHLFFMTFDQESPVDPPQKYVPRVFGFRINDQSPSVAHLASDRSQRGTGCAAGSGTGAGAEAGRGAGNTADGAGGAEVENANGDATMGPGSGRSSKNGQRLGLQEASSTGGGGGGGGGGSSGRAQQRESSHSRHDQGHAHSTNRSRAAASGSTNSRGADAAPIGGGGYVAGNTQSNTRLVSSSSQQAGGGIGGGSGPVTGPGDTSEHRWRGNTDAPAAVKEDSRPSSSKRQRT